MLLCSTGNEDGILEIICTGDGPWTVIYAIDGVAQAPVSITASPFDLLSRRAGTYTIESVSDVAGCPNDGTGQASIQIISPLHISNIETDCNPTNTEYVVTFQISDGDPSTYAVSGLAGSISSTPPYIFTSDPQPNGSGFSVEVSDAGVCDPVTESVPIVDCGCTTEIGDMTPDPINQCGTNAVTANYDDTNQVFDPDDLLLFVLHTNSGVSLGTIIATNTIPEFGFDDQQMNYGETYYISAVGGSNDGSGSINLSDPCLAIAQGTPVVFYQAPTVVLQGSASLCEGESAILTFTFTGDGPWDVEINDGTSPTALNGISANPYELSVTPTSTTTYSVTQLSNENCPGTTQGTAIVEVHTAPEIVNVEFECNGTNTFYTVTFEIINGDPDSYSVTGNPGQLVGNIFTSDPIPNLEGYAFTVSDDYGCAISTADSPIVDCGCETEVGTMEPGPIEVCGPGTAIATYDPSGQAFDTDDIVLFVLHTGAGNQLGTILNTSSSPEFNFDDTTMDFETTYYISAVGGSDDGNGSINFNDVCLSISLGTPIEFHEEPQANLQGGGRICEGETFEMTVDLTGIGPWILAYNDGQQDIQLNVDESPFIFSTQPTQSTNYQLVSLNNIHCPGAVTGNAAADVVNIPEAINIDIICNTTNTEYVVTFEIQGGDPTSYAVDGGSGQLTGSLFTSDPIPNGSGYAFEVSDGNACGIFEVESPPIECDCSTESGTILLTAIEICGDGPAQFTHNADEVLDGNDLLLFVLHDGTVDELGTILQTQPTAEFSFDPIQMQYSQTYFIAAIAGNDNSGQINLADPCLSVSVGAAITFYAIPSGTISADPVLCQGDDGQLIFSLQGVGPFDVQYSDGTDLFDLTNIQNGHEISIQASATQTFTLLEVTDLGSGSCSISGLNEVALVEVNIPPFADIQPQASICNTGINGGETILDFSTLILSGDATGIWEDVDISGATGTWPMLDFEGAALGIYTFRYTTANAILPCENAIYEVEIEVRDCTCPDPSTLPPDPLCNIDGQLDLSSLQLASDPGSWIILSAPAGVNPATISGSVFNASGADPGDYLIEFRLTNVPVDCPETSTQTLTVVEGGWAGTAPAALAFCNNEQVSITLFDLLVDATANGSWQEVSTSTLAGDAFDAGTSTLQVEGLAAAEYRFEYVIDAQPPCDMSRTEVIIRVEQAVDAGLPIDPLSFCEEDENVLQLTDLLQNAEAGGIWQDVSTISTGAAFDAQNGNLNIAQLNSGSYQFEYNLAAVAPCASDAVDVTIEITPLPIADAGEVEPLDCGTLEVELGSQNTSQGPDFSYIWRGGVLDSTQLYPMVSRAGNYTLIVTNELSGCSAQDAVTVEVSEDVPILGASSIEISCFGDADGTILVEGVTGGTPPYRYSLNGAPFTTQATFQNLTPGTYTLQTEDAEGCLDQLSFELFEPEELNVGLTVNLDETSNLIRYGDSARLSALVTGEFDTVIWSPAELYENCIANEVSPQCLEWWVSPLVATTYYVNVANDRGCEDQDAITVYVEKQHPIFIPSAFSPNGDGENDVLHIFSGQEVKEIKSFLIFDRWGESVFSEFNFQPNDPAHGWNGQHRGKPLNPAVFVYVAEVVFKDGLVELFSGDVTLIR